MLGTTGEKRSRGTYQVQHEVKTDRLELFDLERQNGRYLADFLKVLSMQSPAFPCRSCHGQHGRQKISSGELKDLGPAAERWECMVPVMLKKIDYC